MVDVKDFNEATFRDLLAIELNGKIEVQCVAGRVDILTMEEVIEVKYWSKWKAAVGQILVYGSCFPNHRKRVHLYGDEPNQKRLEFILNFCKANNIYVSAHYKGKDSLWYIKYYHEYEPSLTEQKIKPSASTEELKIIARAILSAQLVAKHILAMGLELRQDYTELKFLYKQLEAKITEHKIVNARLKDDITELKMANIRLEVDVTRFRTNGSDAQQPIPSTNTITS